MESFESKEQSANEVTGRDQFRSPSVGAFGDSSRTVTPSESQTCSTCGAAATGGSSAPPTYIYALGTIETRFPRLSVEKEFIQAVGRIDTQGLTEAQATEKVLGLPENRYLARQLCWVLNIENQLTYILHPRDPGEFALLISSVRSAPNPPYDVDVVVGVKGPLAPPELCNGLTIPMVVFDQIYSFDRDSFIKTIPRPEKIGEDEFKAAAESLFNRIQQMADNAGATDADRARNYLALRYPAIYRITAEAYGRSYSLEDVRALQSPLSAGRNIVEVVFTYVQRTTGVPERHYVRVDVTEEFPFLVTPMSPYYDRS